MFTTVIAKRIRPGNGRIPFALANHCIGSLSSGPSNFEPRSSLKIFGRPNLFGPDVLIATPTCNIGHLATGLLSTECRSSEILFTGTRPLTLNTMNSENPVPSSCSILCTLYLQNHTCSIVVIDKPKNVGNLSFGKTQ